MAMNAISIGYLINNRSTEQPKPDLSTDDLNLELTAYKKADPVVLKVAADIEAVQKDTSMSFDGQQKAIAAIGTKAVPMFAWLSRMRDAAVNAYDEHTRTLLGPLTAKPKGDPTVIFLREQELRQGIPRDKADTLFLLALETDDLETCRALLDAPGRSLITDEIKQRGQDQYAQRTNPTVYAQRSSKELLRDELEMLVGVIRSWLLSLGADEAVVDATLKG